MTEALLIVAVLLLIAVVILQLLLIRKKADIDLSRVEAHFQSVKEGQERTERTVREEIAKNRQESIDAARQAREELGNTLKAVGDTLNTQLSALTQSNEQKLDRMRETVEQRIQTIQEDTAKKLEQVRQDSQTTAKAQREEIAASLKGFGELMLKTFGELGSGQRTQLGNVVAQLTKLTEATERKLDAHRTAIDERLKQIQDETGKSLDQIRQESGENAKQARDEVAKSLKDFNDSMLKGMGAMAEVQKGQMEAFSGQLSKLTESNQQKLDALKTAVEEKLTSIQADNATRLEQMRATVDEKLQVTLEKRLGESFKQVSERLEQVHKGLGEMQSLATGVGDLKKVLSNVKTRGTWGEVQLGTMLEQVMTPDQYSTNVDIKGNGERVEYAIKFPGRGEDKEEIVWLPIDAKFPTEDYQRLVEAQEKADPEAAEAAIKQLENRIKGCAWDICNKYINPPKTTDFGILFLPTEGLFAEVVRRVELAEVIRRECHVMIAGPTTLYAILSSLQMGFKTLAIQKRSSEVWNLLAAVKVEWKKYGDMLGKVHKKLQEASNTIEDAGGRARAIGRKLKSVEELPAAAADAVLMLGTDGDGSGEETVNGEAQ